MHLHKKIVLLLGLLAWFTTSGHSELISLSSGNILPASGSFISSSASPDNERMEHSNAPVQNCIRNYQLNDLNLNNVKVGKYMFFSGGGPGLLSSISPASSFSLHRALNPMRSARFYIIYHRLIV